mmetsp:Transcript_81864/g.228079  ORF Transcript_81864/g.228079 Transcript_81864/m.228079 type:complete len:464 (-) Transcript_81864:115-1506(-)
MVKDHRAANGHSRKGGDASDTGFEQDPLPQEAKVLVPSTSKPSANAGFISFEELAVTPPPLTGWVPQKNHEHCGGTLSPQTLARAEWWGNTDTNEWIYHNSDDMYYHLPTSSLWERRDLQCCDPEETTHTYFRVDAPHLRALSKFASSLDSALVPIAWSAWVSCVKEVKRDANAEQSASVHHTSKTSVGTCTTGSSVTNVGSVVVARKKRSAMSETGPGEVVVAEPKPTAAAGLPSPKSGDATPKKAAPAEWQPALAEKTDFPCQDSRPDLNGRDADEGIMVPVVDEPIAPATVIAEPPRSDTSPRELAGRRRRRAWFLCFRGRNSRRKIEYGEKQPACENGRDSPAFGFTDPPAKNVPETIGTSLAEARIEDACVPTQQAPVSGAVSVDADQRGATPDKSRRELHLADQATKISSETTHPHTWRLEQFLADVRKNPQRLVNHVDRRRAEKVTLGFTVAMALP